VRMPDYLTDKTHETDYISSIKWRVEMNFRHYPGLGPTMHIHESRDLTLIQ
jgi:hypothetical protein